MYEAILIAADGGMVHDHLRDTVEEVEEALADQGSRWYFYPFHCVVLSKRTGIWLNHDVKRQRLASVAPPFENFKGRTVNSLVEHIQSLTEEELYAIVS